MQQRRRSRAGANIRIGHPRRAVLGRLAASAACSATRARRRRPDRCGPSTVARQPSGRRRSVARLGALGGDSAAGLALRGCHEAERCRRRANSLDRRRRRSGRLVPVATRVLVIDNYDSFVYNLVQYLGELGAEPIVVATTQLTVDEALGAASPTPCCCRPGPAARRTPASSARLIAAFADARHAGARRVPRPPGHRPRVRRLGRAGRPS